MQFSVRRLLLLFILLKTVEAGLLNDTSQREFWGKPHADDSSEESEEFDDSIVKHVDDEADGGDSDVSEERNEEDFINRPKMAEIRLDESRRDPNLASSGIVSVISSGFNSMKTFACPKIKTDLISGTSSADLSPEDITVIAGLGDALGTGVGLFPQNDIEFRGAAFTMGGDANVDGLITIPSILREFNSRLIGVSHGMGTPETLPRDQLNVAQRGATSSNMTDQARELVSRMRDLGGVDLKAEWVLVIMTIGTEEVCAKCRGPDHKALLDALKILHRDIPKALVVLLGPIHVSKSRDRHNANLLKSRCECSRNESNEFMLELSASWSDSFARLHEYFEDPLIKRDSWELVALPMLTITSRYPYSLFIKDTPLLNRRGHSYAAKWLWNRLIGGDKYNLSSAILSTDAFFCPSIGCPYFRSSANAQSCRLLRKEDAAREGLKIDSTGRIKKPRRAPRHLYTTAITAVTIAFFVVLILGTFFYQWSKRDRNNKAESDERKDLLLDAD